MTLIDLTLTLTPDTPGVAWDQAKSLATDGWNARTLHLYSHCGTHMDAPLHFECGAQQSIDETPLQTCLTRAHVVRLHNVQPSQTITVQHLGRRSTEFQAGDSLLLQTGWSAHCHNPSLYREQLPRVSVELAEWCVEVGVAILGVEPPSVANVLDLEEVTLIHQILLGGGVTIVEGLTNLEALPDFPFLFGALPLKIQGGDGAPCRAFASTSDLIKDLSL